MSLYERYTQGALASLAHAAQESRHLRQPLVEPEHLLLGLLLEGGTAATVLSGLGVTLEGVRALVPLGEPFPGTLGGSSAAPRQHPLSPLSHQVVSHHALVEALAEGSSLVDTEHLLLALVRVRSRASEALSRVGADPQGVRTALTRYLAPRRSGSDVPAALSLVGKLEAQASSAAPADLVHLARAWQDLTEVDVPDATMLRAHARLVARATDLAAGPCSAPTLASLASTLRLLREAKVAAKLVERP